MFNDISWQSYWATLALITTSYYLAIYLLYFRNDVKINWNRTSKISDNVNQDFAEGFGYNFKHNSPDKLNESFFKERQDDFHTSSENEEQLFFTCLDELTAFLEESKRSKCVKEDLIASLQRLLQKYPTTKNSEFKESLTKAIIIQCEDICSIRLNTEEVNRVVG